MIDWLQLLAYLGFFLFGSFTARMGVRRRRTVSSEYEQYVCTCTHRANYHNLRDDGTLGGCNTATFRFSEIGEQTSSTACPCLRYLGPLPPEQLIASLNPPKETE